jgi:hypothetical protein
MQELFEHFEVNREPRWPILSRLAAVSILFHASVLATVLYVPGIRESFNIAALMSRTTYVDRAYTKTEIGEDIHLVNVQKFHYPEGYFATENPQVATAGNATVFPDPWAPSNQTAVPEESPLPSPSPSPTPEASPSVSPGSSPVVAAETAASPETEKKQSAVEAQLDQIAEDNSVVRPSENEVNTRPLKDWLARADLLRKKGELDLSSKVEIKIEANLTTQCKLQDAKVVQKSGDMRLVDVAKDMVAAIGDSGMLSFLRDPKKVQDTSELRCDEFPLTLSIKLDQDEIAAIVESQADSPTRAAEMAKGYSGLLAIGQYLKRGRDEEQLYKATKVTAEGKQILVNFSMPRQTASEMLKKQLPAG